MMDVAERLATVPVPSLADLGGAEAVKGQPHLATDLHADRLVGAIVSSGAVIPDLFLIVLDILRRNRHPLVLATASQHVATAALAPGDARTAQKALLERTSERRSNLDADLASEALAGAFLLAQAAGASRPSVIAALDDVRADDKPMLVARAARLAGLAWQWSRSPDLTVVLERLAFSDEASDQALYELAVIALDDALGQTEPTALVLGLEAASEAFSRASAAGPDMDEAAALGHAVSAVAGYCTGRSPTEVESDIALTRAIAGSRLVEMDRAALRGWLSPSFASETAWYGLVSALEGLPLRLQEASWLNAVPVLRQLGRLRESLAAGPASDGLRAAVIDRTAGSLVAREGLRAHVRAWADDAGTPPEERANAEALLETMAQAGGGGPGKPSGGTGEAPDGSPDLLQALARLDELGHGAALVGKLERVYVQLTDALRGHPDYTGTVRSDVRVLIKNMIRFLAHCLDVTPTAADGFFDFLFALKDEVPLERELQKSLWHSLCLSADGVPQHQIHRETPDIGAGRADISVTRPDWRCIIEIKRELVDASREGIRKYLGQAASYLLTGPKLGFLVVLDLCSQKDWSLTVEDNCWVEQVQGAADSAPRAIIVWRIPGGRPAPSSVRTPTMAV
ncbi:hypothetical protein [Brevundimonas sp. MEB006b]|uniref:hypothetical protein n=1 Tax=Brevundimonas sp. MEB006b TaxID=3040283 RepID=UPI002551A4A3|nr:hypothetical protein [Brevundimonas sp. MEB006b]